MCALKVITVWREPHHSIIQCVQLVTFVRMVQDMPMNIHVHLAPMGMLWDLDQKWTVLCAHLVTTVLEVVHLQMERVILVGIVQLEHHLLDRLSSVLSLLLVTAATIHVIVVVLALVVSVPLATIVHRVLTDLCHALVECSAVDLDCQHLWGCVRQDISVNQEPLFLTPLITQLATLVLRDTTVKWEPLILHLVQEACILMLLEVECLVIVLTAHLACTVLKLDLHNRPVCVQLVSIALEACLYPAMSATSVQLVITVLKAVLLH